jgi:pSer/pThr/pTyr-binding forkhead associated (FHA) protein
MTRSLTFGQAPASETHVHVDDQYCSIVHCRIIQRGNRCWVEDCGSTNGTFIVFPNGSQERIWSPTQLAPGDRVRIGRTTLPWSPT